MRNYSARNSRLRPISTSPFRDYLFAIRHSQLTIRLPRSLFACHTRFQRSERLQHNTSVLPDSAAGHCNSLYLKQKFVVSNRACSSLFGSGPRVGSALRISCFAWILFRQMSLQFSLFGILFFCQIELAVLCLAARPAHGSALRAKSAE